MNAEKASPKYNIPLLGSENRKKESRMVVTKRQKRGKPTKTELGKVQEPEWGAQVKQTALLASPLYTVQTQGEKKKNIKRGAKIEKGASLLFWVGLPSHLQDAFSFVSK